jgi:hypothetical protein
MHVLIKWLMMADSTFITIYGLNTPNELVIGIFSMLFVFVIFYTYMYYAKNNMISFLFLGKEARKKELKKVSK